MWTVDSQVANGLGAKGALSGAVQTGLGCSFVGEEARWQGRDSIGGKGGGIFQSRQLTSCLLCIRDKVKKRTLLKVQSIERFENTKLVSRMSLEGAHVVVSSCLPSPRSQTVDRRRAADETGVACCSLSMRSAVAWLDWDGDIAGPAASPL